MNGSSIIKRIFKFATVYALLVSFFVFHEMTLKRLWGIIKETIRDTALIGFVTAASAFYGWVLARCCISNAIAEWLAAGFVGDAY